MLAHTLQCWDWTVLVLVAGLLVVFPMLSFRCWQLERLQPGESPLTGPTATSRASNAPTVLYQSHNLPDCLPKPLMRNSLSPTLFTSITLNLHSYFQQISTPQQVSNVINSLTPTRVLTSVLRLQQDSYSLSSRVT